MSKYVIFKNEQQETNFWTDCFTKLFDGFISYDISDKEDDGIYGVDVWVNKRNTPIRVGVQLKTQRNLNVNLPYAMSCKSGWSKRIGIYTYTNSHKLDYLIIAYPYTGECYRIGKTELKRFWDQYKAELGDYSIFDWTNNEQCKKYYFSLLLVDFLSRCKAIKLKYDSIKVKKIST